MAFSPRVVLVTASGLVEARSLAKLLVENRLAACVNLVPGVESHYWWQGKLETATEILLVIKSSAEQFEALAEMIKWHHSYETPEILAFTPQEGVADYLAWWEAEMKTES